MDPLPPIPPGGRYPLRLLAPCGYARLGRPVGSSLGGAGSRIALNRNDGSPGPPPGCKVLAAALLRTGLREPCLDCLRQDAGEGNAQLNSVRSSSEVEEHFANDPGIEIRTDHLVSELVQPHRCRHVHSRVLLPQLYGVERL